MKEIQEMSWLGYGRLFFDGLREAAVHIYHRINFFPLVFERLRPLRLPTSVRSVLFVCKGNICRSPLAAAYFQLLVEKAGTDMVVRSAGLETTSGKPAHFNAKSVALEHQFSLDVHSTTQVHADLLNQSDLIIVF